MSGAGISAVIHVGSDEAPQQDVRVNKASTRADSTVENGADAQLHPVRKYIRDALLHSTADGTSDAQAHSGRGTANASSQASEPNSTWSDSRPQSRSPTKRTASFVGYSLPIYLNRTVMSTPMGELSLEDLFKEVKPRRFGLFVRLCLI